MALTFAQKENIGLQYVLDAVQPASVYGVQMLRQLQPMGPARKADLQRQLEQVDHFLQGQEACRKQIDQLLRVFMRLKMVRGTVEKCAEASLNEIELFEIKRFLLDCLEIKTLYDQISAHLALEGIAFADTAPALDLLDPSGNRVATFYLEDAYYPALQALRQEKREVEAQLRQLPSDALQAQRSEIAGREELELQRIHSQLSLALRPYLGAMLHNMQTIAQLDLIAQKARLARRWGATRPELTEKRLSLQNMINPKVADLLESRKETFTPISIELTPGATVITGANMGGKSVALKTIALNILLVHYGFFPFASAAQVPLFDDVHIISEDLESVDRGLSSFGGEMVRFVKMCQAIRQGFHFILLDEFARGTNPQEGAAIVRAVTQYLNGCNGISVLATHYDHVAQHAVAHYQVTGLKNVDWQALAGQIAALGPDAGAHQIARHMNYGLFRVVGRHDCPRDALNICRLLGMAPEIVENAEKTMSANG